jgi:hypothetical protein
MHSEEIIFNEALQRTSRVERAEYLRHACDGDAQLRQKIQSLLDAHEQSAGLLDSPVNAISTVLQDLSFNASGTTIGPYKLLEPPCLSLQR